MTVINLSLGNAVMAEIVIDCLPEASFLRVNEKWRFGNRRGVTCGVLAMSRAFRNSLSIEHAASG
jgi:hypothetical protein